MLLVKGDAGLFLIPPITIDDGVQGLYASGGETLDTNLHHLSRSRRKPTRKFRWMGEKLPRLLVRQ